MLTLTLLILLSYHTLSLSRVILGNQILRDTRYHSLHGHRVAVLTNPTGVFMDTLDHIVDIMSSDTEINVVAVFGPEHGFRGDKQAETGDEMVYIDSATKLPVFSAYNMNSTQIANTMEEMNITAVVVDMQDVGVRLYTFIWTMYDVMEGAKERSMYGTSKVKIVVCDRPNPLGGERVEGPLLNMSCCSSGYGKYRITHIHGLTIGELSLLFNEDIRLPSSQVEVIRMRNWHRDMNWEETGLLWIPPSPNVPTPNTALSYGATVFLEATTIAEGRGTTTPFELFGAPFLDALEVASRLNHDFSCPNGASAFRAAYFQPTFSKYNGSTVAGAQWMENREPCGLATPPSLDINTTNKTVFRGDIFYSGTLILTALRDISTPSSAFEWDGSWFGHPGTELIDQYAGTPEYRLMIDAGVSSEDISAYFESDVAQFVNRRKTVLLYP